MANLKKELLELSFAKPYHIAMKKLSLKFMLQEKQLKLNFLFGIFQKFHQIFSFLKRYSFSKVNFQLLLLAYKKGV